MFRRKARVVRIVFHAALICCLLIGLLSPAGAATTESVISNNSFESDLNSWFTNGSSAISIESAWAPAGGGGDTSANMYATETGTADAQVAIPNSNAWIQISLPVTVSNGQLKLGFSVVAPADPSGKWVGINLITRGFHLYNPEG